MTYQVGIKLFQCNRCMAHRPQSVPICPGCRCPEYAIRVVAPDGSVVRDEEARRRLMEPARKKR